ncbi:MAG: hypothetical protein KF715_00145 [Candidatus Didemnitutus sp.]|nr:hypothetical protein [Candidatus Didemnitutus sp.]
MKLHHLTRRTVAALALGFIATVALAQGYPQVPADLKAAAEKQKQAADRRSDEIFARQLPEIEAWAAKGKPYLPGAAKPADLPQAKIPAFPGAWGGGMYSFGGRGGKVIVVTSLADSGPGTLREALETAGPRIIVFNVAGIIHLKDHLRIRAPYVTLVGNTAPGDGVCIAGNTVEIETHDVIVRHLRFRRGETDPADRDDSLGGNPVGNIMIDHVSTSWSLDENLSMYRHMYQPPGGGKELKLPTVNITIQNSISSESLSTYHHAFGSTIGGLNSTFHHNLWACNTGRNPSVGMYGDFTFANNVLFNWRHRTIDGGDHASLYNIINNYFKPGPGTPDDDVAYRILKPESERSRTAVNHFGKAYVAGNVVEGNARVTKDNWDGGVQPDVVSRERKFRELMAAAPKDGAKRDEFAAKTQAHVDSLKFYVETEADALKAIRVNEPFAHAQFPLTSAQEAFAYVVAHAGAYLPTRDAVDARVLEQVRTGKIPPRTISPETPKLAKFYGYQQKFTDELPRYVAAGFVTNPSEVGGYPDYQGTPYVDSDGDGMPDAWETAHGLNPHDASDALKDANGDGYTNIEKFIYGLDPRAPKTDWTDLKNNVDPLAQK